MPAASSASAPTRLLASPVSVVQLRNWPLKYRASPWPSVVSHTAPSLVGRTVLRLCRVSEGGASMREKVPPLMRVRPASVPIQSVPAESVARLRMERAWSSGVLVKSKTVKRTPSKRTSPSQVPPQR